MPTTEKVILALLGSAVLASALAAVAGQSPASQVEELIRGSHFKRARALVQQYTSNDPASAEALWLQSWMEHVWGNLDKARDLAQKATALDDKNARYHLRLAEASIDTARQRGTGVLEQMKMAGLFKREIELALSIDPANMAALRDSVQFHATAPMIAGGSKDTARQLAAKLAQIDAAEGFLAEAKIAAAEKQPDRVLALQRKAVEAKPNNYEARIALAKTLAAAPDGDKAEVETHARKAIEIAPDRVIAYDLLAQSLATSKRWADLDKVLTLSAKNVPDNLAPYYEAAAVCIENGIELPRAEGYLRKYLGAEPEPNYPTQASAQWRLGQALEKLGKRDEAMQAYQESVKLNVDSPAKKEIQRIKG